MTFKCKQSAKGQENRWVVTLMMQFVKGFKYMQEKTNLFKEKYCEIIVQNNHFHHDKNVARIIKYLRNLNKYIDNVGE